VIEPAAGADRTTLALLVDAYDEDEVEGEARVVLRLHPRLAPYKAAVFLLLRMDGQPERARRIYDALRRHVLVDYDEPVSIGRRLSTPRTRSTRSARSASTGAPT